MSPYRRIDSDDIVARVLAEMPRAGETPKAFRKRTAKMLARLRAQQQQRARQETKP